MLKPSLPVCDIEIASSWNHGNVDENVGQSGDICPPSEAPTHAISSIVDGGSSRNQQRNVT